MSDSDSNDGSCSPEEEGQERSAGSSTIAPTNKRKRKDVRRRIRKILAPEQLEVETVTAQKEEEERLRRLELQKSLNSTALQEARNSPVNVISPLDQSKRQSSPIVVDITTRPDPRPVILIDDSDDDDCDIVATKTYAGPSRSEPVIEISDSESDQSEVSDDSVTEEPETSGSHTNDDVNQPDNQGRVLVNVNHPPTEPDIFLSPYLSSCVKPHQIGGIRFLYDNLVESLSRFEISPGFGCILAHSMGLGKTLQVICFIDVLLSYTKAKKVLCIVPMNTIQNWYSEFNSWLPEETDDSTEIVMETTMKTGENDYKPPRIRKFKVFLFNDNVKTTMARSSLIKKWDSSGGVLLMGYEMYRILAMYSPSLVNNTKLTSSKRRKPASSKEVIDLDEEERNMDLLLDIQKALCKPGPDLVVCDEGHRIKNNQANISQALKKVNTRRRVVLTGYPLQNNLVEYWCMVDFVRPNFLGTRHEFSNMFERPITNGQCVDSTASDIKLMRFRAHVLHSLLEGFVQRRSEAVLIKTLPEKEEYVIPVKMSPIQLSLYKEFVTSVKKYAGYVNPIKAFSMCIKIWNHPDILKSYLDRQKDTDRNDSPLTVQGDPDLDIGMKFTNKRNKEQKNISPKTISNTDSPALAPLAPDLKTSFATSSSDWVGQLLDGYEHGVMNNGTKMMILCEIIEKTVSLGERLLVFSQSLSTLSIIEDFMRRRLVPPHPSQIIFQPVHWERNKNYYRLDGGTSSQEREKLIRAFNSKNNTSVFLFLLSTRACSLGVNLIGANRVVVFDASWNPCHDAQAVCRIYRYGQNKKCFIYRLVSFETFEKRMYERQITKEGMSDRVIDELNPDANLTKQEVMSLFNEGDVVSDDDKDEIKVTPTFSDQVLNHVCDTARKLLFQTPFKHKIQTTQKSKSNLTKAEKREARKAYEREKRAITANKFEPIYERNSALLREQMRREAVINRPVVHVKPIQNVRPTTLTTKPSPAILPPSLAYTPSSLTFPPSSLTLPPLRSLATGGLLSNMPGMSYMPSLVPANPYARYFSPGELRPLPAFPPTETPRGPVTNNSNGILMDLLSTPSFHMTPSTSAFNGLSSSAVLSSQVTPSQVTSLPGMCVQAADTVTAETEKNADVCMPGVIFDLTDDVNDLMKGDAGVPASGVTDIGSGVDDKLSVSGQPNSKEGPSAETVTSAPLETGVELAAE